MTLKGKTGTASAVAHLASEDMGYVTGQTLFVDGGFLSAGALTR